uniref:Odorant receptor n=1 Tax=Epiphyas postvittana TaxID=65032 RepID=A0A0K8TUS8_EPIPO
MFGNLFELSNNIFAFNLKYLFLAGLWPSDKWARENRFMYKMYEVSLHVLAAIFLIVTGIGTYRSRNDIMTLLGNVDKSLVGYNLIAKVIVFLYKRKQLEILITKISHSGDQISEERKKVMLMHVVVVTGLIMTIAGAFSCLAFYNNEMTIEAWMPFDPMDSKMNLMLSMQILIVMFTVPCVWRGIAMQGMVCSLVMYVCDQLVEVQERIRALVYSPESERAMREKFKDIIKKHIRLMGYSQAMTGIFKEYFLIQNLAVTLELCLSAFMATIAGLEQQSLLASFIAFLCVALLNAYIYCYLGDELIVQSQGVALSAYESTWTSWPLDLQKDLLVLIRAAQKPFKLSAGGMAAMSMQTYSQTLYNGYSIFAVLNDAVD